MSEPFLGTDYKPPDDCDVWYYESFWFYGTDSTAKPPGYTVWKRNKRKTDQKRIGHMFRSDSGFGLFLFKKKTKQLPWFLGYYEDTGAAGSKLVDQKA